MSHFFDNKYRYQIVYPYTSDKIYVESSIDHGAYKCYQEIKEKNIMTYIFIVHDIDASNLYYFNIPKNKSVDPKSVDPNIPVCMPQGHEYVQDKSISLPTNVSQVVSTKHQDNEIILRINNLEHKVNKLKKKIKELSKEEECVIM